MPRVLTNILTYMNGLSEPQPLCSIWTPRREAALVGVVFFLDYSRGATWRAVIMEGG